MSGSSKELPQNVTAILTIRGSMAVVGLGCVFHYVVEDLFVELSTAVGFFLKH